LKSPTVTKVYLSNITPAELLLARAKNGQESAQLVEVTGEAVVHRTIDGKVMRRYVTEKELAETLQMKYTPPVFEKVFPGANYRLPRTFEEVGIEADKTLLEVPKELDEEGWEPVEGDGTDEVPPASQRVRPAQAKGLEKAFSIEGDTDKARSAPRTAKPEAA
jgi:hypothetical protein